MILRVCVVIPTYNNSQTILSAAEDVLLTTPHALLIVDDGSQVPVHSLMTSIHAQDALKSGRLKIARNKKNAGKGAALQKAISLCLQNGFTHMLTMDGDGQHLAQDIHKVTHVAQQHPWDLVIGHRRMQTAANVPQVSKFGRAFSNFWVGFQTGTDIADSQSGFRLYPLFRLQNMRFWCKRYDFEIEVLIRLMWSGAQIHETEIDVFYPKKEDRVSHFNKLWDNARISLLNVVLVSLSLIRSPRSPVKSAISVGAGVLIGCTPFLGFHTLLAGASAFLFRLNAMYVILGTQISFPPVIPFIVLASVLIGDFLIPDAPTGLSYQALSHFSLNQWLHYARTHFLQWLVGSLVVGTVLGGIIGLLVWRFSHKLLTQQSTKTNWNGRTRGGKWGNAFLKFVIQSIGIRAGYFCLLFIAPYFYFFAPKARRALNEYWQQVDPTMSFGTRQMRIVQHFFRFGQTLMDRIYVSRKTSTAVVPYFRPNSNGIENIMRLEKQGQGFILLGAHVGSWDMGASLLQKHGFEKDLYMVEFKAKKQSFHQVADGQQPAHKKRFTSTPASSGGPTIFEIYEILNSGQSIGLMADRPLGHRYELVQFFGKLAPFDITPFRLAATAQAPVIFSFGFKGPGPFYNFYGSTEHHYTYNTQMHAHLQCRAWAQEFATHLENRMRQYPDQWFNFYPFWSAPPSSPTAEASAAAHNHLEEELHTPLQTRPAMAQAANASDSTESQLS